MALLKLGHFSVRTADLDSSRRFYTEVLGLRIGPRPPFPFPGLWLYGDEDEDGQGLVHIIGEDAEANAYLGGRVHVRGTGTGHLDHIAFLASGWADLKRRCNAMGVPYVENTVPALGIHQVFLQDPSGITIEMNYPAGEAGA